MRLHDFAGAIVASAAIVESFAMERRADVAGKNVLASGNERILDEKRRFAREEDRVDDDYDVIASGND